MPYAVASVKSFIANGDIDGLQGFVNDLNTLSENIDSFITEIPGYLERYQQIMDQKRALEEEDARRRAQQAEIDKRLREEFGIGTDAGTAVTSGAGDVPQEQDPLSVSADDLIGDLGFDFTTPDDGTDGGQVYQGDGSTPDSAYPIDGNGYGDGQGQDMDTGYQAPYGQQDGQYASSQQMPDDGQGYQMPYGADDFMGGYGDGTAQDGQYVNQMPDASFGQNPATSDGYDDMAAMPMDPSAMSQAPDMYADDDMQMPTGDGQQQGYADNGYQQQDGGYANGNGYPQDGGYGDGAYQDGQDGFDPFAQGADGGQPQYQGYDQQDAYAPQQGYDQAGGYQDLGQGYDQDATGYDQQGYGDGQMPQGYAEEPSSGMSMEDLMAEADQNQPPKKRGRRKRGKGSGLKVTPQQQGGGQQPQQQAYDDDAARMDALLDDDFDM